MILHEIFFDGLGDESEPGQALAGGARARLRLLRALARGVHRHGQGAGRRLGLGAADVVAARPAGSSTSGRRTTAHTLAGGMPILALDMYEHSYHIDFGAKAATYVDTFMQSVRWGNADRLYAVVSGGQSQS